MHQSWTDLDHAVEGLSLEEATARYDGGSSIAWTVGHVTNMVDSWLNVRFQGLSPDPVISNARFRTGGSGEAQDWPEIQTATRAVRASAMRFLEQVPDLSLTVPYTGSIPFLQTTGLQLGYALMRITAHHFMHAGEIHTLRSRMGKPVPDVPDWGRTLIERNAMPYPEALNSG
jgi:uncharacterized damage-inducible protein DinB